MPCSSGMADPNGTTPRPFTVLVADDNEVAQRLCKRVLEKAGYAVLIAADGLQAVAGDQDRVARFLEHALAEALRDLVVIDHKHGEGAKSLLRHAGAAARSRSQGPAGS